MIFTLLSLFTMPALTAADSSTAVSLKEIDRYIADTDYTKALEALSSYIADNPEDFDSAQKRINKIMKARLSFNQQAKKLVSMMDDTGVSEDDLSVDDDKMEIISNLEKSEQNQAVIESLFTNDARRSIRLVYYKNKINQIINAGKDLYGRQEYYSGVKKLEDALILKTSTSDVIFDGPVEKAIYYGEDITVPVASCVSAIKAYSDRTDTVIKDCIASSRSIRSTLSKGLSAPLSGDLSYLRVSFEKLASVRNDILQQLSKLKEMDKKVLSSYTALNETSYITFAAAGAQSIVDYLDGFYIDYLDGVCFELTDAIKNQYGYYVKDINIKDTDSSPSFTVTGEHLNLALTYADAGIQVTNLYKKLGYEGSDYTQIKSICKLSADLLDRYRAIKNKSYNDSLSPEQLISMTAFYKEQYEYFNNADLSYYETYHTDLRFNDESEYYHSTAYDMAVYTFEQTGSGWQRLAVVWSDKADDYYRHYLDLYNGDELLSGTKISEGSLSANARFNPLKSYENSQKYIKEISLVCTELTENDTKLGEGMAFCENGSEFGDKKNNIVLQSQNLKNLIDSYRQLGLLSQKKINEARIALNTARDAVQRAKKAMVGEYYDTARNLLNNADEAYSSSLQIMYDESVVKERNQLMSLAMDINSRQSKVIIVQAQELRRLAWSAYYEGNFALAKKYLEQAKTQWAKISTEEDEETAYILGVVTAALSTTIGRYYEGKDTMYSEFSQTLNQSLVYYNEGLRLIDEGNRKEALVQLTLAKQKLRGLLQTYPVNHDVNHLLLLIEQLEDKQAFDKEFARKVEEAKKSYNGANAAAKKQLYASLSDLSEIYPDYPGLKELLLNVEYDLGLKMRPVKKSETNTALKLYEEAVSIYDKAKGNENQLNKAVAKLNESLRIDPRNAKASELKVKIQGQMGSRASDILSAEDNEEYLRAIQIYTEGNTLVAQNMVKKLMDKNGNSKNKKLVALMKRIEASL